MLQWRLCRPHCCHAVRSRRASNCSVGRCVTILILQINRFLSRGFEPPFNWTLPCEYEPPFLNGPAPSWMISTAAFSSRRPVSEGTEPRASDGQPQVVRSRLTIRQSADRCMKQLVWQQSNARLRPQEIQPTSPCADLASQPLTGKAKHYRG